jgi:hypothetical protein
MGRKMGRTRKVSPSQKQRRPRVFAAVNIQVDWQPDPSFQPHQTGQRGRGRGCVVSVNCCALQSKSKRPGECADAKRPAKGLGGVLCVVWSKGPCGQGCGGAESKEGLVARAVGVRRAKGLVARAVGVRRAKGLVARAWGVLCAVWGKGGLVARAVCKGAGT